MAEPFIGEVRMVGFSFAPKYWALCNGQVLSIAQNQALFSLLGTTYGGDGRVTFALPNLMGRAAMHTDNQNFQMGAVGGQERVTLLVANIPTHTHTVNATSANGSQSSPSNNYLANGQANYYAPYDATKVDPMNAGAVGPAGGNASHENRSPYLVINFIIALSGIFPPRN